MCIPGACLVIAIHENLLVSIKNPARPCINLHLAKLTCTYPLYDADLDLVSIRYIVRLVFDRKRQI